jgi:hypothetical protein
MTTIDQTVDQARMGDGKDEMCMFCVVFGRLHARSGVGMSVSVSVSVGIGVGEVSVGGVEVGVEVGEVWENSIGPSFCTASTASASGPSRLSGMAAWAVVSPVCQGRALWDRNIGIIRALGHIRYVIRLVEWWHRNCVKRCVTVSLFVLAKLLSFPNALTLVSLWF